MAIASLLIGAAVLLGGGYFTSSLIASLADPVALILAAAAGVMAFVEILRRGYFSDYFSTGEGEVLGSGIAGATIFYIVFVTAQSLIVQLSPLAGLAVVGLGVTVAIFGPGLLFDLLQAVFARENRR